ncbi:hypothetical protein BD410DRAFT_642934 [Rickenella mellea]|uniref:Uncharacterized protein n=1 Tax=Rickenella mellea TaxID=50990 RepID=A0A4Y7PNW6_9AGAM|nr:hypothetical protein BD410DRAFT_642934 [Rickenella mellea]
MSLRRRLSRRTRSTHDSAETQNMEHGSSSVSAAARAATPVALTALAQSSDAFPPLKSAVSFLLQVHDICEKMESNRDSADELRVRVGGVRDSVAEAFQDEEDICLELYDALIQFDDALNGILAAADDVRWRKSRLSRLAFSSRDAETLRIVKQRLVDAMNLLMLIVALHQSKTLRCISQTLDMTVFGVTRVEQGLVSENGQMRAQLARVPRERFFFFFLKLERGPREGGRLKWVNPLLQSLRAGIGRASSRNKRRSARVTDPHNALAGVSTSKRKDRDEPEPLRCVACKVIDGENRDSDMLNDEPTRIINDSQPKS